MIDPLSTDDLIALWDVHEMPSLSIYVPMQRFGAETRKNPILFKNAVQEAERQLEAVEIRPNERDRFLAPLRELQDDYPFWLQQESGLVVFRTADTLQMYRKSIRFPELTVVSERFHLKPLLRLFSARERFFLLALSMGDVRLYEGSRMGLHPISLGDTPTDIETALRYDQPEESLQLHSRTPTTQSQPGPGGRRPAMFHGQGVAGDDRERKKDILRFFQLIDRGVREAIQEEYVPLLIAGIDYELPIYREANTYPALLEEEIQRSVEALDPSTLHALAWETLQEPFDRDRKQRVERLQAAKEELASTDTLAIVTAARAGRVDTVFVPVGVQRWGRLDPSSFEAEIHEQREAGDVDLLDTAAIWTARNGGVVYVEDPQDTDLSALPAAVFRY
jgi:hypothetical protein